MPQTIDEIENSETVPLINEYEDRLPVGEKCSNARNNKELRRSRTRVRRRAAPCCNDADGCISPTSGPSVHRV